MGTAQKGLLALGVLLLLVVLAAGNCGPDEQPDEGRMTMTESTEGVGDSRARTSGSGSGPPQQDDGADAARYSVRVRVLDDASMPLTGARAVMLLASAPAAGPAAAGSTGSNGRVELEGLPAGDYLLNVSAAGYLSTGAVPLRLPDEAGGEVVAQLRSAGRLDGALYGLDGQARTEGLLRLTATSGGTRVFHVQPDERGDFQSGPLEPGVWELAWIPQEGDPPDPRLTMVRALAPGERVRVEVTLAVGGRDTAPGRRVGIVEQQR